MGTARTIGLAIATLVTAAAVAGCSGSPASTTTPSTSALAPPITQDQLSLGLYANTPCDLLNPEQLQRYGVTRPGVTNGATCRWTPASPAQPSFQAQADLTSGGLEQLYRQRGGIAVFEPTQVSGYPAVNTATSGAARQQGHCTVEIGVATTALLDVSVDASNSPGGADACHQADLIATLVMANVKISSP